MFLSRRIAFSVPGQSSGAITYFNGTEWVALPPGTAGHFLRTGGPGAAPYWSTAPTFTIAGETSGDLVYYNGSAWTRLPIGSAGQVLSVSGGAPAWSALPAFSIAGQTQGDVLYFNGTLWTRLAASTAGHVLTTQGVGSNPTWAAVPAFSIAGQTQGDVLYFNGTIWTRLPAGTAGFALTTQGVGANPTWAPADKIRVVGSFVNSGAGTLPQPLTLTIPNGVPAAGTMRIYEVNVAARDPSKYESIYLRILVSDTPAILPNTVESREGDEVYYDSPTGPSLLTFGSDLKIVLSYGIPGFTTVQYRASVQEA